MLQAVMRKVQISRQLRTMSRTIRRLGERFNANDVTNDSAITECPRVTTERPRSAFCDVTFTRQTYASGSDSKEYSWYSKQSATGPFSETGVCCGC